MRGHEGEKNNTVRGLELDTIKNLQIHLSEFAEMVNQRAIIIRGELDFDANDKNIDLVKTLKTVSTCMIQLDINGQIPNKAKDLAAIINQEVENILAIVKSNQINLTTQTQPAPNKEKSPTTVNSGLTPTKPSEQVARPKIGFFNQAAQPSQQRSEKNAGLSKQQIGTNSYDFDQIVTELNQNLPNKWKKKAFQENKIKPGDKKTIAFYELQKSIAEAKKDVIAGKMTTAEAFATDGKIIDAINKLRFASRDKMTQFSQTNLRIGKVETGLNKFLAELPQTLQRLESTNPKENFQTEKGGHNNNAPR